MERRSLKHSFRFLSDRRALPSTALAQHLATIFSVGAPVRRALHVH